MLEIEFDVIATLGIQRNPVADLARQLCRPGPGCQHHSVCHESPAIGVLQQHAGGLAAEADDLGGDDPAFFAQRGGQGVDEHLRVIEVTGGGEQHAARGVAFHGGFQ